MWATTLHQFFSEPPQWDLNFLDVMFMVPKGLRGSFGTVRLEIYEKSQVNISHFLSQTKFIQKRRSPMDTFEPYGRADLGLPDLLILFSVHGIQKLTSTVSNISFVSSVQTI